MARKDTTPPAPDDGKSNGNRKDNGKSKGNGKGKDSGKNKAKHPPLPPLPPLAGSLLLAHPRLSEGVFRRSVILLPMHDENGSMGIILNQPLHKRIGEISGEFVLNSLSEVPVFNGGPVAPDRLMFCAWRVHGQGIGLQLMLGLDPEKAMAVQHEQGTRLRAFFGHAGWDAGQLERELRQNTWIVMPLLPGLLEETDTATGDAAWRNILGKLGPRWHVIANEPDDPRLN